MTFLLSSKSQITSSSPVEDIYEVFNCVYCHCTTAYPLMQCAEGHMICEYEGTTFKTCPGRSKTEDEAGRCGAELISVGLLWYKYLTHQGIYACPVPSCTGLLQGQEDQKNHIRKMHPDEYEDHLNIRSSTFFYRLKLYKGKANLVHFTHRAKDLGMVLDQVPENKKNEVKLLELPSDLSCPLSPVSSRSSSSASSTSSVITVILEHKEPHLSPPAKDGSLPSCSLISPGLTVPEKALSSLPTLPMSTVSKDNLPSKSIHPDEEIVDGFLQSIASDWPQFLASQDFGNEDIRNSNKITSISTPPPQKSKVCFGPSFSRKSQLSEENKLTEHAAENRSKVDSSDFTYSSQYSDNDGWPPIEASVDNDEDEVDEITDHREILFPCYSRQATSPSRFHVPKSANAVPSWSSSKFHCPRSALGINRFPSLSRDPQGASSSRSQEPQLWKRPTFPKLNQPLSLDEDDMALNVENKEEIDADLDEDPANWPERIRGNHKTISYSEIHQELLRIRNQYTKPTAQNPQKYYYSDN